MQGARAAAGSLIFLVLAPGVVAGLVPWWLTSWQVREPLPHWLPLRVAGSALLAAGVIALLHAFARFVVEGLGTPAPVAPTEHLVVGGLYGYVRNPMYLAVAATIVGQALALGQLIDSSVQRDEQAGPSPAPESRPRSSASRPVSSSSRRSPKAASIAARCSDDTRRSVSSPSSVSTA